MSVLIEMFDVVLNMTGTHKYILYILGGHLLKYHRSNRLSCMIGVSVRTIRRRVSDFGLSVYAQCLMLN